jgi:hypothetical protein
MTLEKWDITKAWQEYQKGIDFKESLDLYETVDENYNFFYGNQWGNIPATNLPTPAFNIFKRSIPFMVAQVKDRKLTLNYTVEGTAEEDVQIIIKQVSDYAKKTWKAWRTPRSRGIISFIIIGTKT